jgi:hypothetical protein
LATTKQPTMSETCKNCNSAIDVNFCSHCGQKKAKRIDSTYIKDELLYVLVHTNKGFFYSVKKVAKAPGRTALEFIEGNRVNHYKPILLVFLLAGISAFIANTFIHPLELQQRLNEAMGVKNDLGSNKMADAAMKYQSLFMLASVPFAAVFSWLAFKKWGYNYWENVVANAYLYAMILIFNIAIILPLQWLLLENAMLATIIPTMLTFFSMLLISIWFFIQLYPEKNAGEVILRTFATTIMMVVAIVVFVVVAMVIFLLLNPDKFPKG